MQHNKTQPLPQLDIHSPAYTKFNVQFIYSKRKKGSLKEPINTSLDRYTNESRSLTKRSTVNMERNISVSPLTSAVPTAIMKSKTNEKSVYLSTQPAEQLSYICSGFPQRKKKSNQRQLFKLLAKFSANSVSKHNTFDLFNKKSKPLPTQSNEPWGNGIKPHLKVRLKGTWIKDRYCVNRSKGVAVLQDESSTQPRNPFERADSVRLNKQLNRIYGKH